MVTEAEIGGMLSSQGMPRTASKHQKLQEARQASPLQVRGGMALLMPGFHSSQTVRQYISVVSRHPVCETLYSSSRKQYRLPESSFLKKCGMSHSLQWVIWRHHQAKAPQVPSSLLWKQELGLLTPFPYSARHPPLTPSRLHF